MVNVISNQLTTLTASSGPEKAKPPVKVDLPVVVEARQEIAADRPVYPPAETDSSQGPKSKASDHESVSVEDVARAVAEINLHFQNLQRDLKFSVDRNSGHQVITVLDSKTKEVIRQIPAEEVQALARMLQGDMGSLIKTEA
ncbi:MAG: flagellar protein FlaG [Gammaproteobacteria bacterium]|nr:MAG: flagellar protein FlaG [Gammaproteobacteria bacterium]TND06712.1 MAG: flagellar protein FlaG [Gammaproteobacteria bacterium]